MEYSYFDRRLFSLRRLDRGQRLHVLDESCRAASTSLFPRYSLQEADAATYPHCKLGSVPALHQLRLADPFPFSHTVR